MLDKLSGTWAPKPSPGPHKTRESLPLVILLRNRLKYALTKRETDLILMQRHVKVDQKVRTDSSFPAGFMDVITIEKTGEKFRLLYDIKGRFNVHRINDEESKFKLARVQKVETGKKGIPYLVTHDGRTIRYPNPDISEHDTVQWNFQDGKIVDFIKFDVGNLAMITGGRNLGRIGVIERREKHPGSYDIVHLKDSLGHKFATRLSNVFVIGKGLNSLVSIPKNKGIKLTVLEERQRRTNKQAQQTK